MAATQFHAALAIEPKNVESMMNLSTVETESGRRDQARAWLMRALEADPRNAEAHYNLGLPKTRPATARRRSCTIAPSFNTAPPFIRHWSETWKRISDLEFKNWKPESGI